MGFFPKNLIGYATVIFVLMLSPGCKTLGQDNAKWRDISKDQSKISVSFDGFSVRTVSHRRKQSYKADQELMEWEGDSISGSIRISEVYPGNYYSSD